MKKALFLIAGIIFLTDFFYRFFQPDKFEKGWMDAVYLMAGIGFIQLFYTELKKEKELKKQEISNS